MFGSVADKFVVIYGFELIQKGVDDFPAIGLTYQSWTEAKSIAITVHWTLERMSGPRKSN